MTSIKELQVAPVPSFKKDACYKCGICVNLPNGGRRRISPSGQVEVYTKPISECLVKNGAKAISIIEAESLLGKSEKRLS